MTANKDLDFFRIIDLPDEYELSSWLLRVGWTGLQVTVARKGMGRVISAHSFSLDRDQSWQATTTFTET